MKNDPKSNITQPSPMENRDSNPVPGPKSRGESALFSRLPRRYEIKESNGDRVLTCVEAPNVAVHVVAGLTVSAAAARKSSPGTIYLDGVAQSEPFMDLEKQIYNFDHHEGCLRAFTLSTCEQVLVVILKGLDLRGRNWAVFANEPDLDTVLAVWLLLNHLRIQQNDCGGLHALYALVRLEGIIDAHGLEMTELSGFPVELVAKIKKMIDYLRAEELDLKKNARWEGNDHLEYTASILQKIDRIVYRSGDFVDFKELKELARVETGTGRIVVVVDSDLGIYELEPHLNRVYGESLGLVVLKKGNDSYTLRRLDPFMPGDLNKVYQKLNSIDPAVRCRKQGNRWGGSGDIGGSPRGMATKLTPEEIALACRDAFQKLKPAKHAVRFFYAAALVGAISGAAAVCSDFISPPAWIGAKFPADPVAKTDFTFFIALLMMAILGLIIFCRVRVSRFGIQIPTGKDWWLLLPVAVLTAMAGGTYSPALTFRELNSHVALIYVFIAIPLACELLFRSLVHGVLSQSTPIQSCCSRWFFSWPSIASAFLYAAFLVGLVFLPDILHGDFQMQAILVRALAAFGFGLTAGFARERSHSVFPGVLFYSAAMAFFVLT
jgi:membrane protease YdiL (CAAX protease family)